MELLNLISQIPLPILLLIALVLIVTTAIIVYQWVKMKGLEGIRAQTYQLILKAEHIYEESSQGKQKLKWVVSEARKLLPPWLRMILTESTLTEIINIWFLGVKDLLDDGKVNKSIK